jgi:DNA-binding transcriptional ArsR family regulator
MMEKRRDVFQAIADPTRREIINLIAQQPLNLNAIADHFDSSRPTISEHVKLLAECGLLVIEKKGRERYCEARFRNLREVFDWVEQYKVFWETRLDKLGRVLTELRQKNRKKKR